MSQPIEKTTLHRLAWIQALRLNGHRKCVNRYIAHDDGNVPRVCALGLLWEVVYPHRMGDVESPAVRVSQSDVGELAGLTVDQTAMVIFLNDGSPAPLTPSMYSDPYRQHSFAEIADIVEGWFK